MPNRMRIRTFFVLALGCVLSTAGASRRSAAATLQFDEFGNSNTGNGVVHNGMLKPDPGPGGLSSVMTYPLPFTGVQGDVLIAEDGGTILDVVRFNGDGTVLFYSDNVDGFDAPADTIGPPRMPYANTATATEVGPEGNNRATYIPSAGQPGFDPSGPTYVFVSDGSLAPPAPAPAASTTTLALMVLALLTVGARFIWRRRPDDRVA